MKYINQILIFIVSFTIPILSVSFIKWSFNFKETDRVIVLTIGFILWFAIASYNEIEKRKK
jgi:hypothetical protein